MLKGKCIIFSAPSGSGKTTLVKHLLNQKELNLSFSISATTRQKREGEIDGKDYFFKSKLEFKKLINNGDLLEFEEVYDSVFYGSLKGEVLKLLETRNVIFESLPWRDEWRNVNQNKFSSSGNTIALTTKRNYIKMLRRLSALVCTNFVTQFIGLKLLWASLAY